MDAALSDSLDGLRSGKKERQDAAYAELMAATEAPVPWAYEIWDDVVALLTHASNRTRSIASQVLCNLAKSDPDARILDDLDALVAVTKDERTVTARHCMQSLWKVGVAGAPQRRRLLDALQTRFSECADEKNGTLTRYDIVESLRKVYESTRDASIPEVAQRLIASEDDPKYRTKYARLWPPA